MSHPQVVEILDALSEGPHSVRDLTRVVGARRRAVSAALRVMAADGLVRADHRGSWDEPLAADVVRLTGRGEAIVDSLSRFEVWMALYER